MQKKAFIRFVKYSTVGLSTFLVDISLLYVFTEFFGINYLISAGIAFLITVSLNYYLSRIYVFSETTRGVSQGYYIFIGIAVIGLLLITSLMALLVEIIGFNYLFARVLVGGVIGICNYLINLFFNFKVVDMHK